MTLKEMLDMESYPPEFRDMIEDYRIHLLEVRKYKELENFHTDIQYVFGFLQNESSKEALTAYISEHETIFENLSEDAYDMISVMAHSVELQEFNKDCKEEGGRNMCQAIKEMIEDGRLEGRESINKLIQQLIKAGRNSEIERAVTDAEYQKQLLEEYKIL